MPLHLTVVSYELYNWKKCVWRKQPMLNLPGQGHISSLVWLRILHLCRKHLQKGVCVSSSDSSRSINKNTCCALRCNSFRRCCLLFFVQSKDSGAVPGALSSLRCCHSWAPRSSRNPFSWPTSELECKPTLSSAGHKSFQQGAFLLAAPVWCKAMCVLSPSWITIQS